MNNRRNYDFYTVNNSEEFSKLLAKCLTYPGIEVLTPIEKRYHHRYFKGYLYDEQPAELRAKTIVVEKQYTSTSYLGDYKNYYANCYKPYKKTVGEFTSSPLPLQGNSSSK